VAYSEVFTNEKEPTCAAFLVRAVEYFTAYGITHIEWLLTDDAWAYHWSLRQDRAWDPAGVHQTALS
jgi:hypothetical protein